MKSHGLPSGRGLCWLFAILSLNSISCSSRVAEEKSVEPKVAARTNMDGHEFEVPEGKQRSAKVQCDFPIEATWTDPRWISAKLALDPDRHFAITTSVDVVIEDHLAELGTRVPANHPILKLSAPEITQLRGRWQAGHGKLKFAKQKLEWQEQMQANIQELEKSIDTEDVPKLIETFSKKKLGIHGGKILEALARWNAAKQMNENTLSSRTPEAVPRKILIEREAEMATSRAALEATIQQVTFDVAQETLAAKTSVEEAISNLGATESELHHMQGSAPPSSTSQDSPVFDPEDPRDPDAYIYRTPRPGIVLERFFARGERAGKGEILASIADLSELWVMGEMRTQDWDLIASSPGQKMKVEIPGLENLGALDAELVFVGGNVDPETQSIRFAASIKNPQELLRPGMYARMAMVEAEGPKTLVVPASAIFSNLGTDYVLETQDGIKFVLRRVSIGRRNDWRAEILSGVSIEKKIMTRGVFSIASEIFIEEE